MLSNVEEHKQIFPRPPEQIIGPALRAPLDHDAARQVDGSVGKLVGRTVVPDHAGLLRALDECAGSGASCALR